jgi:hypothetical integral membrane protein (TIGR02206 family)
MAAAIYFLLRRRSLKTKTIVLFAICLFNIGLYLFKLSYNSRYDWFNIWEYLPFDLCGLSLIFCPLALLFKSKLLKNYVYFIAAPGGALALIVPNGAFLGSSIFTPQNIMFYLLHMIIAIFGFLFLSLGFFKLSLKDMLKSSVFFLFLALFMHGFNTLVGTIGLGHPNYFFTMYSPQNPLLDIFWKLIGVKFFYLLPALPILVGLNAAMYFPVSPKYKEEIVLKKENA